jgi:putative glutamine amidotransferase
VGWSTDDNLIEAVIHKDNDFVLGVQWHPEMMVGHYEEQLEIFKYFINLAL